MITPDESVDDVCNCGKLLGSCLDIATPLNSKLTPYYKRSFAHHTVKVRMPVILTKLIDSLVRNKQDILDVYSVDGLEELKAIIGKISKLKHDIQTNKDIPNLESTTSDAKEYNLYLKRAFDVNCHCTYFNMEWLFVECFMYRRIAEFFTETTLLQDYDYFASKKRDQFESATSHMMLLARNIIDLTKAIPDTEITPDFEGLKEDFKLLLKVCLWSNKCDLSLSAGHVDTDLACLTENIQEWDANILCDDTEDVYAALCRQTMFEIIDFVCDNAGYEIFTDLCLADFLISNRFCKEVRFFVKMYPWFISDVTKSDIHWILERLRGHEDDVLRALGERWTNYVDEKVWHIEESNFWTMYLPYSTMMEKDEALFRKLARSKCTFYKGDLNYRKLLGDRNWDPVTPFEKALEGYYPSRLCTLRTCKADLICGLREGLANEMEKKDEDWLISGNYAVIQFCGRIAKLF